MALLLNLLRILEHWLQIQAIRARWELQRDIEYSIERCEDEIQRARAAGNDALADRLRQRLLRSSGIAIPKQPDSSTEVRGNASGKN